MGKTFQELGNNMPGLPGQLSPKQIEETRAKFAKHEKIVAKMTDEERAEPQLMFDDLKDTENKCPRVQVGAPRARARRARFPILRARRHRAAHRARIGRL